MAKKELKQDMSTTKAPKVLLAAQPPKVDFDAWWAVTNKKMPPQHRKEIVMADFKAQGLSKKESMSAYDTALEKYGVKLK